MKYYLFTILTFFYIVKSFGQNQTYSASELDSISKLNDNNSNKNNSSFKIIENIPIHKGCENEKDNAAKKKCMSQKITELFKNNFNTVLPKKSELESCRVRIMVNFVINKEGKVSKPEIKAPIKYLEKEALRVLKLIPDFKPGYFRDNPIDVPYSLPIIVNVSAPEKTNFRFPVFRGCNADMTNIELEKCSMTKIKNFIKMSYDLDIADVALPLEKSTKFLLEFTINEKGKVKNVNAKAHHRAIAIEAIRVAQRLPKFKKPAMKNGKPISTPYKLEMTIYF